jgi:mannose-6-phosphate isomerase-like protein (cupin superfamily)
MDKVNLAETLRLFDEHWRPKTVAALNDYELKVVKVKGEFVWHQHEDTDELFLALAGRVTIQMRDANVEIGPGELFVVPRGVEHCPRSDDEAHLLLIEPAGTPNTGDAGGEMTATAEGI